MTNPGEKRHTAGPWRIGYQDGSGKFDNIDDTCCIVGADNNTVGHIRFIDNEANARLIAAAPDLYEALKGLLESKALQEAPFYNYSEAVLRGREALSRAVPEGGRE